MPANTQNVSRETAIINTVRRFTAGLTRVPGVWLLACATGLLHLVVAGRYDIFRNELYFIVCGRHPDFGYVDQPPLIPLISAATQLFGENIWLLRLPAALAAAALVPLTAEFARMFAVGAAACGNLPPWLTRIWLVAAATVFVALLPIALPILDPPALERYIAFTHLAPVPEEAAAVGAPLTQIFSDELGWRALEQKVAAVFHSLPPADRTKAAILTTNYGEAAALDVYGSADGLPPALCGQNQYFLWGSHGYDGQILIHVNGDPNRWRRGCENVDVVGKFGVPYAMPYENERPIFICRGLRRNLGEIWERLKRYQ
jgi:hypothetical protein